MLHTNLRRTSPRGPIRLLWDTWFGRSRRVVRRRRGRPDSASAETLETRTLLAAQVVTPDAAAQTVAPGNSFAFDAMYSTADPQGAQYTGLALRMHYDSTQLTFDGLTNTLAAGLDSQQDLPDAGDLDNDPSTDRFVVVLWFDISGTWPAGVTQPARLYTAAFTTAAGYTGTQINFTAETAADVEFQSTSVTVAESTASLDVDANGNADLFTDGILIARYLVGFTGQNLVRNAIGSGATRTAPAEISAFLEDAGEMLDVDGNGTRDLFTDGILIARYLVGFTGQNLVRNAVGSGATRTGAQQITDFLDQYRPPAGGATAAAGGFAKGGPVADAAPSAIAASPEFIERIGQSLSGVGGARTETAAVEDRDTVALADQTMSVPVSAPARPASRGRTSVASEAPTLSHNSFTTAPRSAFEDELIDTAFTELGSDLSALSFG
ncbi:MAG: hypothetical protein R3C19_15430 [Planctomycetaceae bacterium]